MAKKSSPSKSSTDKTTGAKKKQTELLAIELPVELAEAMDKAGFDNRKNTLHFLLLPRY